jgi:hypothetical protein
MPIFELYKLEFGEEGHYSSLDIFKVRSETRSLFFIGTLEELLLNLVDVTVLLHQSLALSLGQHHLVFEDKD